MSDPFGNLAMQQKGDMGLYDGHQYQPSSQLPAEVAAQIVGPRSNIWSGWGTNTPAARRFVIVDGSSTNPVTTAGNTALISRDSSDTGGGNVALNVLHHVSSNSFQSGPAALLGQIRQYGPRGDAVGSGGIAIIDYAAGTAAAGQFNTAYGNYSQVQDDEGTGAAVNYNGVTLLRNNKNGLTGSGIAYGQGSFLQVLARGQHVSITIASPGVFSVLSDAGAVIPHQLSLNQTVRFTTSGALPTGVSASTIYFVKTIPTASTFTISATAGGVVINTSGSQSGTHSMDGNGWLMGAGYAVFANDPVSALYENGFRAYAGSVSLNAFLDESSATTSLNIKGTHTTGIDTSSATISGQAINAVTASAKQATFKSTGANTCEVDLDNAAGGHQAVFAFRDAGAAKWVVGKDNDNSFIIFSNADAAIAVHVVNGTPGANKTNLWVLEGATPTLRQFTTFDPGAAGANFTAGQLVAVLV